MLARQQQRKLDNRLNTESTSSACTSNAADDCSVITTGADDTLSDGVDEPPTKKRCTSLFANYKRSSASTVVNHELQLTKYLSTINSVEFDPDLTPKLFTSSEYHCLRGLFSRIFSIPASSAPVERIFSHSGLIMKPHRARMSDSLLEALVYLKCN